jgi:hypothetical protein
MHRIVDAGAARIGLVLGQTGLRENGPGLIDHTLLNPKLPTTTSRNSARKPPLIASRPFA